MSDLGNIGDLSVDITVSLGDAMAKIAAVGAALRTAQTVASASTGRIAADVARNMALAGAGAAAMATATTAAGDRIAATVDGVRTNLAALATEGVSAKIGVDAAPFWAGIAALRAEAGRMSALDINVDANVAAAAAKISALRGSLGLLTVDSVLRSVAGGASGGGGAGGAAAVAAGAAAAGGGGGGGLTPALLTSILTGGAMAAIPGFHGLLGLAGLGPEHVVATGLGIAGSAGMGVLGGLGAAAPMAVGMGSDMAVMTSTIADTKTLGAAMNALTAAQTQYGASSVQAQTAASNLNQTIQSLGGMTAGVAAEMKLATAVTNLNTQWDRATSGARVAAVAIGMAFVPIAQQYIPMIASAAQRNFTLVDQSLAPILATLRGPAAAAFADLENIFASHIPASMSIANSALRIFINFIETAANTVNKDFGNSLENAAKWLQELATGAKSNEVVHFAQMAGNAFYDWIQFLKQIVVLIAHVFGDVPGTGTAIITTLTQDLKNLNDYLASMAGKNALQHLLDVHKTELLTLLQLLPPVLADIGGAILTVEPPLVQLLTGLVKLTLAVYNFLNTSNPVTSFLVRWGVGLVGVLLMTRLMAPAMVLFGVAVNIVSMALEANSFYEFIAMLGFMINGIKGATVAMAVFDAVEAIGLGWIALIVVGIAALIAVIVLMATHWKQTEQIVGQVWRAITAAVVSGVNAQIAGLNTLIAAYDTLAKAMGLPAIPTIALIGAAPPNQAAPGSVAATGGGGPQYGAAASPGSPLYTAMGQTASGARAVHGAPVAAAPGPWQQIVINVQQSAAAIEKLLGQIVGVYEKAFALIVRIAEATFAVLFGIWVVGMRALLSAVEPILTAIANFFSKIWNGIVDFLKMVWNDLIVPAARAAFQLLQLVIITPMTATWHAIQQIWDWINQHVLQPAWDWIKATVGPVFLWVEQKIEGPLNNVRSFFVTLWSDITKGSTSGWAGIKGAIQGGVNDVIQVLDPFIEATNSVLGAFGLAAIPIIGMLGGGGAGSAPGKGGPVAHAAGGIFDTPTAIVGEGGAPEVVIPLDPQYRSRALALHAYAGSKMMAAGGILGGIESALLGPAESKLTSGMSGIGGWSGPLGSGIASKLIGAIGNWISSHVAAMSSALTGTLGAAATSAQVAAWIVAGLAAAGKPLSWLPDMETIAHYESGDNPNADQGGMSAYAAAHGLMQCLSINAGILTQRGWLTHDQVRVGDYTIGFNPATGMSEWTRVTKVVHYDDAPVWRIGHKLWHADVTPNHRWWSEPFIDRSARGLVCPNCERVFATERGMETHLGKAHHESLVKERAVGGRFVRTDNFKAGDRLRLAAVAATGPGVDLTLDEIRLVAWILGDGSIARVPIWHRADETYEVARIYQSKPPMVAKIQGLLEDVPHSVTVRQRQPHHLPGYTFHLNAAPTRHLLDRSRVQEIGPEAFVLSLTPDQRHSFLDAIIDAEGHRMPGREAAYSEFVRIAQVNGPVQDAIKLAVYLEGYRPTFSANSAERNGFQPAGVVGMAKPYVAPSTFDDVQVLPNQTVWCVKTDLETWTARQDGQIFLTGNTIMSTFEAYRVQSLPDNVHNPVANVAAAANYIAATYGNPGNTPGIRSLSSGGPYMGYDQGGLLQPGISTVFNGTGKPEAVLTPAQLAALSGGNMAVTNQILSAILAALNANVAKRPAPAATTRARFG